MHPNKFFVLSRLLSQILKTPLFVSHTWTLVMIINVNFSISSQCLCQANERSFPRHLARWRLELGQGRKSQKTAKARKNFPDTRVCTSKWRSTFLGKSQKKSASQCSGMHLTKEEHRLDFNKVFSNAVAYTNHYKEHASMYWNAKGKFQNQNLLPSVRAHAYLKRWIVKKVKNVAQLEGVHSN